MKYILLQSGKERYWLELDNDNYANRQIILDADNRFHISCKEECLAEGQIYADDLDGDISYLGAQEFETMWKHILKKYKKQWKKTKKKYPIGTNVQGIHSYLYPQGIIVRGKDFIAIHLKDEKFSIGKVVQYKVAAYDNINMWLIVE